MASLFDQLTGNSLKRLYRLILQQLLSPVLANPLELEKLEVSVRDGLLTLQDLDLNLDFLNSLLVTSPLVVSSARLSRIRVKISYATLLTESCVVEASGLSVSFSPRSSASASSPRPSRLGGRGGGPDAADGATGGDVILEAEATPERHQRATAAAGGEGEEASETKKTGIIAAWADQILSRLKINLQDLSLSFNSTSSPSSRSLVLALKSASYSDETASLTTADLDSAQRRQATKKQVSFVDLSLASVVDGISSPILDVSGSGHVRLLLTPNPKRASSPFYDVDVFMPTTAIQLRPSQLESIISVADAFAPSPSSQPDFASSTSELIATVYESTTLGGHSRFPRDLRAPPSPPPSRPAAPVATEIDFDKLEGVLQMYAQARSRCIRKEAIGGLLHASVNADEYDAFFDCGDKDFSKYEDADEELPGFGGGGSAKTTDRVKSQFKLRLLDVSVSLLSELHDSAFSRQASISLKFEDVNSLVNMTTDGDQAVQFSVAHISSTFCDARALHFVEEIDALILPPVAEVSFSKNVTKSSTSVEIVLQPIEILCDPVAILLLKKFASVAKSTSRRPHVDTPGNSSRGGGGARATTQRSSDKGIILEGGDAYETSFYSSTQLSCPQLTLIIPTSCLHDSGVAKVSSITSRSRSEEFKSVCRPSSPSLLVNLVNIRVNSETTPVSERILSLLPASSPRTTSTLNSSFVTIVASLVDTTVFPAMATHLITLCGEPDISADSVVRFYVEDVNAMQAGRAFDSLQSCSYLGDDAAARCSRFAEAASNVKKLITVKVPSIVADFTKDELECLNDVVGNISRAISPSLPDDRPTAAASEQKKAAVKKPSESSSATGFVFNCEQVMVVLHEPSKREPESSKAVQSFVVVIDALKSHSVSGQSGLVQARVVSESLVVYECDQINPEQMSGSVAQNAGPNHILRVLKQRALGAFHNARPVLYKNNFSASIDPQTRPCLHVDLEFPTGEDDGDSSIYVNLGQTTWRYDIKSSWLSSLITLCSGSSKSSSGSVKKEAGGNVGDDDDEPITRRPASTASSHVTKLFFTCSDVLLDYTSPISRNVTTASRSIIEFTRIHISSNLIPGASIQSYKVTVADVAVNVCNRRVPYSLENSRISCAGIVLDRSDDSVTRTTAGPLAVTLRDFIDRENFLPLLTLDAVEVFISINSTSGMVVEQPGTSLNINMGVLRLYACRDSYMVLQLTFSEWWVLYSTPPELLKDIAVELEKKKDEEERRLVDGEVHHSVTHKILQSPPKGSGDGLTSKSSVEFGATDDSDNEVSLLDGIDLNMFSIDHFQEKKLAEEKSKESDSGNSTASFEPTDDDLLSTPDDQLSAKDLRRKHRIADNLKMEEEEKIMQASVLDFARSLLIENYYTVNTSSGGNAKSRESGEGGAARSPSDCQFLHPLYGGDADVDCSDGEEDDDDSWVFDDFPTYSGEEMKAEWFTDESRKSSAGGGPRSPRKLQIFPNHVPIPVDSDPITSGDMGAAEFVGQDEPPHVHLRVIVSDMSVCIRLFEGYDFPVEKDSKLRGGGVRSDSDDSESQRRKSELLGALLDEDYGNVRKETTKHRQESSRVVDRFVDFTLQSLKLRMDSFAECVDGHRLASCLDAKIEDFFFSETITSSTSRKTVGEWVNDRLHPRDSNDGVINIKLVTFRPAQKFSSDHKLNPDEGRFALKLLPLRIHINQKVIHFVRDFFAPDPNAASCDRKEGSRVSVPPSNPEEEAVAVRNEAKTMFQSANVNGFKVKVDYTPVGVDVTSLRGGNYAELLNLFPLESCELNLRALKLKNVSGWGALFVEMSQLWVQDITATQLHKFIQSAPPFNTLANLGEATVDLVMLPVEEYNRERNSRGLLKGLRRGSAAFANKITLEALATTHKVTKAFSTTVNDSILGKKSGDDDFVDDGLGGAVASVSKGFTSAHKIIFSIPEVYAKKGTKRAVAAIPIAVLTSVGGVSTGVSIACLHLRNKLNPEEKKESDNRKRTSLL